MHGVMRHHHNKRIRGFLFNTYTEKVFLQFQELEIRILGTIIKFKRRARARARGVSHLKRRGDSSAKEEVTNDFSSVELIQKQLLSAAADGKTLSLLPHTYIYI